MIMIIPKRWSTKVRKHDHKAP